MSKNIAFYISDHGFGHIMRNLPVIAHILETTNAGVVLVTGERQTNIAREYIERYCTGNKGNIVYESCNTDFGIVVKQGTLTADVLAMERGLKAYIDSFEKRIKAAHSLFKRYNIDCVVCDIVPWALKAAKMADIPSVLMASFTWIEIYEELVAEEYIKPFRECFDCADKALLYELANEPTVKRFENGIRVGFAARPFHEDKVDKIRAKLKSGNKPVVFVSVGGSNSGLKDEVDVSNLPYTFAVTQGLKFKGYNVYYIAPDVDNSQDYVAASDMCIIKAGWSTVAEVALAGKPMALLSRPDVAEDRMTIDMLTKRGMAVEVGVHELENMHVVLDKIKMAEIVIPEFANDFERIADEIINS